MAARAGGSRTEFIPFGYDERNEFRSTFLLPGTDLANSHRRTSAHCPDGVSGRAPLAWRRRALARRPTGSSGRTQGPFRAPPGPAGQSGLLLEVTTMLKSMH